MTYTISQRISNLKDVEILAKEETKEAVKTSNTERQVVYIAEQKSADPEGLYLSNPLDSNDWLFPSDFALSLGLLTDLGIFKNVEIPFNIWSGSWLVLKCLH